MADSEASRSETKKKKRKTNHQCHGETAGLSSKRQRIALSEQASEPRTVEEKTDSKKPVPILPNLEGGYTWKNLELIMLIENKGIEVHRKVELAYEFVTLKEKEGNDDDEDCQTVKMSRVVVFLNDWVQSLLVSLKKRIGISEKPDISVSGTYLDVRCWKIFKFCLEDSSKLHVSLSFSKNILESIRFFAEDTLSELNSMSLCDIDSYFDRDGFELHRTVLDCIGLVFSSHGGLSNESLGLWISTVNAVVELFHRVHAERLNNSNAGLYVIELSCSVFEPFVKFLRANPTHKKNGFHDFVYKLLEPLLHLLGILQYQVDIDFQDWNSKLLKVTEDVLSYGLFHPVQIDGFFGLNSTEKYVVRDGENVKDPKTVIKSYHRHLFAKLEEVVAAKKKLASCGVGKLVSLLAAQIKNLKGVSVMSEHTKVARKSEHTKSSESVDSTYLTADKRKCLFDVFVLIMEPLLLETNGYIQLDPEVGLVLPNVHCTLKSMNSLLASLARETIYSRTEDSSDGACINFLKKIYDSILTLSSTLIRSSSFDVHDKKEIEMLASSAKEVLVSIGYLLEVEYNVVGGDLRSLWLMMLSYLALELSLTKEAGHSLLLNKIADLSGQLFELYGQLRQVNNAIFPLCKAIRLLMSNNNKGDENHARFVNPSHDGAYTVAVGMLLCSEGFKVPVQKALKSIPEGQASACFQQLITDISETLKWMKVSDVDAEFKEFGKLNVGKRFDLQSELLGKGLSELYTLVLSSITVTTGNSFLIGKSMKDLVTVLNPCLSCLVELHPDAVNKFLCSVAGNRFHHNLSGKKNYTKSFRFSSHWVFVFFFQLHMSCRVLYRQAASFMPPDSSKKMSVEMGDSFMALSGHDWMQKTNWDNDGYFACVSQPSASLDVVIQAVSKIYVRDGDAHVSSLIYVMNAMVIQRLIDLNRHIKSLDYLLQNNECLLQSRFLDDDSLSRYHRKSKKLNRRISSLRQEAVDLTSFMMEYMSEVSKCQKPIFTLDEAEHEESSSRESDGWDLNVSSLNKESLPTAIWWIFCQNIDVWSLHAAKKKLKTFLSLLICSSIPFGVNIKEHYIVETSQFNRITMWKISLELFSNSILYEQRFVCRYLASRFCRAFEESASTFTSSSSGNTDITLSPDWKKVLSDLEGAMHTVSRNNTATNDNKPKASALPALELLASQSLLTLLSWIPKDFFSSKSYSLLLTSVLNFERLIIGSLLDCRDLLCSHRVHELVRLFMSSRKVLKYIIMASCEEKSATIQTAVSHMYSDNSFPVVWLLKSLFVVVNIQASFSKDKDSQVDTFFSLLDHTLYVFLTLNKHHFGQAIWISNVSKSCKVEKKHGSNSERSDLTKSDWRSNSCCDDNKLWKSVLCVATSLREQMEISVVLLKEAICDDKVGSEANVGNMNMYSSVVACLNGFLWGLVSVIKQTDVRSGDFNFVLLGWKDKPNSEIELCINVFEELSGLLLGMLLLNDSEFFQKANNKDKTNMKLPLESLDRNGDHEHKTVSSKKIKSTGSKFVVSFMTEVDSPEELPLDKQYLRNLLNGSFPEAAFLLRELFIASSAVLGLKSYVNSAPLSAKLIQTFTGISQGLLLEFVDIDYIPQPSSFVLLNGIVKYLEELGNLFPMTDPTLSRNLYVKIVELHLRAIGKCISLEGKSATLESHETESSTKRLHDHSGLSEDCKTSKPHGLDELKSRLRISFTVFIKNSSELHLLAATQAVERALVGVRERSAMIYDIQIGSGSAGKVSSNVAAGIDCLDLVLESVSGGKRLNVIKRHIQSLIASAFNIILHLQSPLIFYDRLSIGDNDPDPGAVVLMCVEVLKRIIGKHALFQMESWHVAQSLRIPGALFQNFLRLKLSVTPLSSSSIISNNHAVDLVERKQICGVDQRFSINLFSACCRLLYNVLKHHKSEFKRCIGVLDASVTALLHCLETMDPDVKARNGYFSWESEEGVQCAFCLRRIYEEIRHQKEILGRHCAQFLSNYIWVYSGNGPLKTGIKREIDEALRPGVYALIDACSQADLQHLHTTFGEGPCRNSLAALQHDYKLNFQYEGKV